MANYLTFRVDEVEGVTRESIKAFVEKYSVSHCVCYEISDKTKKPHYQGWIRTDVTSQTMGNRIKAQWPAVVSNKRGKSSGKYSSAPVRKESYQYYCLKGTPTELPDIVTRTNTLDDFDVESIHRKWWSQYASTQPKNVHIVEEGIEVFKSFEWSCSPDDLAMKRLEVAKWLSIKYAGKGKNSFLFKNYINGILTEVDESYNDQFCSQIAYSERW